MAKYRSYYATVAESYVEVEAASVDEAMEKADEIWKAPHLCAGCEMPYGGRPGISLGEWEPVDNGTDLAPERSS